MQAKPKAQENHTPRLPHCAPIPHRLSLFVTLFKNRARLNSYGPPLSKFAPHRPMNRAALSVVALATGAVVWFGLVKLQVFLTHGDIKIERYADAEEAKQNGAFDRGWVPSLLPEGTVNILKVHDLDVNTGTGSFQFPSKNLAAYHEKARHTPDTTISVIEALTIIELTHRDGWAFRIFITAKTGEELSAGVWNLGPRPWP
jgi:hypothetical protein